MLLCGMRDALLPAQYTGYECLQAQLKGRRRILLVDPSQSYKGMYPYPCDHTYDRQSMVDLEAPNYDDWPRFAQVKGTVCILEPGEVLYTPMVRLRDHLSAPGRDHPSPHRSSPADPNPLET